MPPLLRFFSCRPALNAAVLGRYEFDTDTFNSATADGVVLTTFNAGAGLTDVTLDAGAWYGETWSMSGDPEVVRESDSYVWFRITTDPGMMMTLTDISFDVRPHGSGPRSLFIDVVDLGTSNDSMLGGLFAHSDQTITGSDDPPSMPGTGTRKTWNHVTRSSGDYQDLVGAFEIRIYGYDAPQSDREVLVDNVVLQGFVTAVPEPSTYALIALAGLAFVARRRFQR